MENKENQIFEAFLSELKAIRTELQLIRTELKLKSSNNLNESSSNTQNEHDVKLTNESDSTDETYEKSSLGVYDWIIAKGITVKNYHRKSTEDEVFDKLATFLGKKFGNLSSVHESIRRSLSIGNSFTLNLSTARQEEISDSTQFCTLLKSYAFLSHYQYRRTTKTIHATPQRVGKVINFFNGGWFERYIYLKITSLLSQNKLEFSYLLNAQITFSNGDDFELDLLFLIDNQPLWIECKTGDYGAYISKYSSTRKLLSIPKSRAILVILDTPNYLTENLTNLYDLTFANESNFLEKVSEAVGLSVPLHKSEAAELPDDSTKNINANNNLTRLLNAPNPNIMNHLPTLLTKAGLRPLPDLRQYIIVKLINIVKSLNQPITMAEVKSILAEKVQMHISKSQLQDILNAVVRSGCLLDDNGQAVFSFTAPFSKFISYDPSVIDSKCIESYVRAVLLVNPTYFEHTYNRDEFERIVGGNVPDITLINKLKEQSLQ